LSFAYKAGIIALLVLATASPALSIKATIDPTEMGVGARPLGMGRAYTALASDCNSVFINPAGLGLTRSWQMTSMYASLLGEINYTLLGFSHAFSREAIGIGYLRADIGDSQIVSYRDPNTGRILPTDEGAIGYVSSVGIFSFGSALSSLVRNSALDDVFVGASLKVFNQELKGGSHEALASGMDVDLGAKWLPLPWVYVGAFGQNILTESNGGVLRWTSGIEESIPALWKVGVGAKIIGWNSPWQFYDHELYVDFDSEMSTRSRPGLAHLGLEWWPAEYFALRLGIDQDAVASGDGDIGIDNNLTAGVGLFWEGFEFDYAYHQFGSLVENDTHYFSFSTGIFRESPPEAPPAAPVKYFKAIHPGTEIVIYGGSVVLTGEVEASVAVVSAAGRTSEVVGGVFSVEVNIDSVGKNSVTLEAVNEAGRKLESERVKILNLPAFSDVPPSYWAREPIGFIAAIGLVLGYPDGTFRPDGEITRAELTTMLMRAAVRDLPMVKEDKIFSDVTREHWAARFIKAAVERKMVLGYPDGTFRPGNNINRAEGTIVVSRFAELSEPDAIYEKPFPDMALDHWAIKMVSAAKDAGLLKYLEGANFEPKQNLTRAEAVEMLSKTPFAQEKITKILDFSTGY